MELTIQSIASGFEEVLQAFSGAGVARLMTRHGVSFDVPGLTIRLLDVTALRVPEIYEYPELVSDYHNRLFGDQRDVSLFYRRLRDWNVGGDPVDQLEGLLDLLRTNPASRSAVFSTWLPHDDLGGDFPVSPVGGCFRLLQGKLHLLLTARSVDLWVGLVPELLAFARLLVDAAAGLRSEPGSLVYHAWSAHIYEADYLAMSSRLTSK